MSRIPNSGRDRGKGWSSEKGSQTNFKGSVCESADEAEGREGGIMGENWNTFTLGTYCTVQQWVYIPQPLVKMETTNKGSPKRL